MPLTLDLRSAVRRYCRSVPPSVFDGLCYLWMFLETELGYVSWPGAFTFPC